MADKPGTGKYALITGASGGIGEEFARLLAAEGYQLVIVARNEDQLNRVAGILNSKHRATVSPIAMDLSALDAAKSLVKELHTRGFSPDVVINNAGYGICGHTLDTPVEDYLNMLDLNVRTLTELSLNLLPAMLKRKRGGILNVASLAAFVPGPYMSVYHASKAYVLSFTEGLASEYAGTGVTISALCPGYVMTGFQSRASMDEIRFIKMAPKLTAEELVTMAWENFKRGDRVIIPGLSNKFSAFAARHLPHHLVMQVLRRINKPAEEAYIHEQA